MSWQRRSQCVWMGLGLMALACAGPPEASDEDPARGPASTGNPRAPTSDFDGLAIAPELADFAITAVGARNPTPVRFTVMHISGPVATPEVRLDSASFRVARNDCQDLQPGRRCSIDVTFAPAAPGPIAATMQVVMPSGTASVSLSGMGQPRGPSTRPREFRFLSDVD